MTQVNKLFNIYYMACRFKPLLCYTNKFHSNVCASKQEISDFYKGIMLSFPQKVEMAFAYGSGVFQQANNDKISKNMVDLIFVVNDPISWHRANIKQNRHHYSFLKWFGSRYIAHVQNEYSAHLYFNTLIPYEGRLIKYGVISTHILVADLLDWNTLYVSGRLHKPVLTVKPTSDKILLDAIDINRKSAVHAALVQLPERFEEEALYLKICALSYNGDFRMTFGENKNKVNNIVKPNVGKFREIYGPILGKEEDLGHVLWDQDRRYFEQYPNHITQAHHLNMLPKGVQHNLLTLRTRQGAAPDLEEILRSLSHSSFCDDYVRKSLVLIVRNSSLCQAFKSIITAGIIKSVKYSLMKIRKM